MKFLSKYLYDDGIYRFSASKSYDIEKEAFAKFLNLKIEDKVFLDEGKNLAVQLDRMRVPNSGLAIELGCGAGRLSGALALSHFFDDILITDAAEDLMFETRHRIKALKDADFEKIKFGVMLDRDLELLPEDSVQAVFLAATLHHFVDWKQILINIKRVLKKKGVIYFTDPCLEFSMAISTLLLSFKQVCKSNNYELNDEELRRINNFIGASKQRGNPFAPGKEKHEDKHFFKIADIYQFATDNSMYVCMFPDSSMGRLIPYGETRPPSQEFSQQIRTILTRTQHFPESLVDEFIRVMKEPIEYLQYFWQVGRGPYSNFIAILQKT